MQPSSLKRGKIFTVDQLITFYFICEHKYCYECYQPVIYLSIAVHLKANLL